MSPTERGASLAAFDNWRVLQTRRILLGFIVYDEAREDYRWSLPHTGREALELQEARK